MVKKNIRPRDILTKNSFFNAICVLAALGGSTNAIIHLTAIAGRCGIKLELRKFCAEILSKANLYNELNHNKINELQKNLEENTTLDNYQIRIVWILTNYLLWRQNTV